MTTLDWMSRANCTAVDIRVFMDPGAHELAKDMCYSCPVFSECSEYADRHAPNIYGTWAGVWYPGPYPEEEDYASE